MNRRNHRWSWLLALGLVLALFIVQRPVEGGGAETLDVNSIGYPGFNEHIYVYGTANYTGTPPNFTAKLINFEHENQIYEVPVEATTWTFGTNNWRLTLDVNEVPDGRYIVEVTATFSTSNMLVDYSYDGGSLPECEFVACIPGP